jgi:mono/diheme cytochrome c family protein
MPEKKQSLSTRTAALLLIILFSLAAYFAYTALMRSLWAVPFEAKQLRNPLPLGPAAAAMQIRSVYLDKCTECHGETGQGNGPQAKMYDPRPSNLTDTAHLKEVTDGELFYVITTGHKPMPSYRKKLTDDQRWQLVLLVRYLSNTVPPPVPTAKPSE